MDEPLFRLLNHPQLDTPIFVVGLPGFGSVGKIAARLFIESIQAKLFAELYSPSFPDYVFVEADGICRLPRHRFYASSIVGNHFVILSGDVHPSVDDVVVHYQLCDEILDFVEGFGCKFIVTMGGSPTPSSAGGVYVAATSQKLASEIFEKGAMLYRGERIIGATGLLLGLAKSRGWKGVCLLGATTGIKADRTAALLVFKFLSKMLGTAVGDGNS